MKNILKPIVDPKNIYLSDIEAFRGIAAILVVYFHTNLQYLDYWKRITDYNVLLTLFFEGHTGVSLFFVLSGFLLSIKWVTNSEVNVKKFYMNRMLRILPLYYVSLMFFLYAAHAGNISKVFPYLLFLQNTSIEKANLSDAAGIYWSLAPEVHFYIILPFLMLYVRRYGFLIGLIAISILIKLIFHMGDSIFGRIDQFVIGIIAADLYFNKLRHKTFKNWITGLTLIVSIVALFGILHYLSEIGGYRVLNEHQFLYAVMRTTESALWAGMILSFLTLRSKIKVIISNPFTRFIGLCSFSIYIWHYLIVFYFKNNFRDQFHHFFVKHFGDQLNIEYFLYATLIVIPVVIIVAFASYLYIERPFLLLKTKKVVSNTVEISALEQKKANNI